MNVKKPALRLSLCVAGLCLVVLAALAFWCHVDGGGREHYGLLPWPLPWVFAAFFAVYDAGAWCAELAGLCGWLLWEAFIWHPVWLYPGFGAYCAVKGIRERRERERGRKGR